MREEKRPLRAKKFLYALKKYRWIHLLILLVALFGGILSLYLIPPTYEAQATLEIVSDPLATEIDLLRSTPLIEKTLRDLGFGVSVYYTKEFRKRERYGTFPFSIEDFHLKNPSLYEREIMIDPVSKERFSLHLKPSLHEWVDSILPVWMKRSAKRSFGVDGIYDYDTPIETEDLSMILKKQKGDFKKGRYTFRFHDISTYTKRVQLHNLDIRPASEGSHIVSLSYRDSHPAKAVDFLDRLIENYLQFRNREIDSKIGGILGHLSRKMSHMDGYYKKFLATKVANLMVEREAAKFERRVLQKAKSDSKPISPNPLFVLLSALMAGISAVVAHSFLRSLFDTRIKSPEDVKEISSLPFYGMIPYVKNGHAYNKAYVLHEPNAPASEAYRAIRNNLSYLMTPHHHKVILVTSSIPNEGKTTFSANLAAVMGMGEKRCILLSLDMRRPELHHKFGLSNKRGMSDLLSGRAQLDEVTWEHEFFQNFDIVTSGAVPPNPAELIASDKMRRLIETLRERYDYIVIDTPPLHLAGDATILMRYADITLFVLKSEFSQEQHLREIEALTKKLDLKNVGLILNSVKSRYNSSDMFDRRYIYYEAS